MKYFNVVLLVSFFAVTSIYAADKPAGKKPAKASPETFRCEKMDANLSGLKDKLLVTCDLDRPYSIAATDNISSRSYTYCCHLKSED